ncbi:MAG: hypothetical protein NVSMB4_04250 [Acidimicrobiales bacterium]
MEVARRALGPHHQRSEKLGSPKGFTANDEIAAHRRLLRVDFKGTPKTAPALRPPMITICLSGKEPLRAEQAMEEGPIVVHRLAELLGAHFSATAPLLLETSLVIRESAGQCLHDFGHEVVRLGDCALGVVHKGRLDARPPVFERLAILTRKEDVGCFFGVLVPVRLAPRGHFKGPSLFLWLGRPASLREAAPFIGHIRARDDPVGSRWFEVPISG